ncbi:hypothetical protein HJG60_011739 [Phyllostomus discolor]|uniref:Uncharacterized protein n=1 Tax=Phyllostomus discolor TaxID=89673 RepID=A0A833ZWF3_9CHIR|nr:hypothetical protein HJG60_011739 [Phyllostomus discolor]
MIHICPLFNRRKNLIFKPMGHIIHFPNHIPGHMTLGRLPADLQWQFVMSPAAGALGGRRSLDVSTDVSTFNLKVGGSAAGASSACKLVYFFLSTKIHCFISLLIFKMNHITKFYMISLFSLIIR